MFIKEIAPGVLKRLTEKHITRYSKYLEYARDYPGQKRVDVPETTRLLTIWQRIQTKNYVWEQLDEHERGEALDAYWDEHV